jgi:hypothetical protein
MISVLRRSVVVGGLVCGWCRGTCQKPEERS